VKIIELMDELALLDPNREVAIADFTSTELQLWETDLWLDDESPHFILTTGEKRLT
jgi:hypothetical protein